MKNITILLISLALFQGAQSHAADNGDKIKKLLKNTFSIPDSPGKFSTDQNKFCARSVFGASATIRGLNGTLCNNDLGATIALYVCPWSQPHENNLFSAGVGQDKKITQCGENIITALTIAAVNKTEATTLIGRLLSLQEGLKDYSTEEICDFIVSVNPEFGAKCEREAKKL
jgi:hypothetical protein